MRSSDGLPCYYDPCDFKHTCLLKCQPKEDSAALEVNDDHLKPSHEAKKCVVVPFVACDDFQKIDVAKNFAAIIKEVLAILAFFMRVIHGTKTDFSFFSCFE